MHAAAAAGSALAVESLLKAGASVAAADASGRTALDVAGAHEGEQWGRVVEVLRAWEAPPAAGKAPTRPVATYV